MRPLRQHPPSMVHVRTGMLLAAAAAATAAAAAPQPVQLCRCANSTGAASQTWLWPAGRSAAGASPSAPIRLAADPSRCLFAGRVAGRKQAKALYVGACPAPGSAPTNWSFVPAMQRLDARDTSVLMSTAGTGECVDADAMGAELQLYKCIADDNDQQYAGIDGAGLIVDLWTGFSNCVGIAGEGCAPPRLLASSPQPPAPPPGPPAPPKHAGVFAERWCPRYHASKGTDPSGALILNGQTFVFPDGSDDCDKLQHPNGCHQPAHHYGSKDLLTWTRYPMGWEGDTGSITVTVAGIFRLWPQGGAAGSIARSKLLNNDLTTLSNWSAATTVVPVPNGMLRKPVGNFRDPSRAVQLADGHYYLAVGSDDGNKTGHGSGITADGVAAMRLFRAADETLLNWTDVGMVFKETETLGVVKYSKGEWSSTPVVAPPFLECPDLYRSGDTVVMVTSFNDFGSVPAMNGSDGMSAEWRTGTLDPGATPMRFVTKQKGVLDYG
eukprot:SAG22_NODE_1168_length_5271_cov_13.249613_4_plen_495_part_00